MSIQFNFQNKIALVTGATGYLGRSFCREFSALGGDCILVDQDHEILKDFSNELKKNFSARSFSYTVDLLSTNSRNELNKRLQEDFGHIDILINNAAYTGDSNVKGWSERFEKQTLEAWNAALEVNLTSAFDIINSNINLFLSAENCSIINVSSIYGVLGPDMDLYSGTSMGNPMGYGVTKAGLNQATRYLASILGPKIRVNSVSPGGIYRDQPSAFINRYVQKVPLKRMATELDIVHTFIFGK